MRDDQRAEILCVCRACGLLFERDAAAMGHYRLVPDARRRLPDQSPEDMGVPVGLVFVVVDGKGQAVAHYPNPLGDTRCEIDVDRWRGVTERRPELRRLVPEVQALLVNTARGAHEHWIVPIDDCYRLVALIRREWRGLSGGTRVWPAVEAFFRDLDGGRVSRSAAT